MLTSCHFHYHEAYGPEDDEKAARENCLAEASALPSTGVDSSEGNTIECRLHHCLRGKTDLTSCPSSIGDGQCR